MFSIVKPFRWLPTFLELSDIASTIEYISSPIQFISNESLLYSDSKMSSCFQGNSCLVDNRWRVKTYENELSVRHHQFGLVSMYVRTEIAIVISYLYASIGGRPLNQLPFVVMHLTGPVVEVLHWSCP
ncbi:hypothetical protein Tco_0177960 [Tanacetum coccineum]|uniref:Uncharacterized protein n=1 Tax=Tanacetum coccineum TaxID=301880 RepID=A0ABQ4ZRC2_9ASTR